eukprot:4583514-Pleurochrysis_carterae.AAC.3
MQPEHFLPTATYIPFNLLSLSVLLKISDVSHLDSCQQCSAFCTGLQPRGTQASCRLEGTLECQSWNPSNLRRYFDVMLNAYNSVLDVLICGAWSLLCEGCEVDTWLARSITIQACFNLLDHLRSL